MIELIHKFFRQHLALSYRLTFPLSKRHLNNPLVCDHRNLPPRQHQFRGLPCPHQRTGDYQIKIDILHALSGQFRKADAIRIQHNVLAPLQLFCLIPGCLSMSDNI